MINRLRIIVLVLAFLPLTLTAQTTRADLAKIRVGKDGNFLYWDKSSNAIDQLKKFVTKVTSVMIRQESLVIPARQKSVKLPVKNTDGFLSL